MHRIAVIGGGPKALFALQELHDRLPDGAEVTVDVFDPAEPGGGAVWRPELPPALRMNSPAGAVDARFSGFDETLTDWLARTHPEFVGETYVPRRLTGAYLRDAFAALSASDRMAVRHVRQRISGLGRAEAFEIAQSCGANGGAGAGGSRPRSADAPTGEAESRGAAAATGLLDADAYDEVLVATGHAGPPSDLHDRAERIPTGAVAVVRGAALTGLDAVALLTEGRGGRWEPTPDDPAGFLTYVPSGREPRLIRVVSRSGAVMSPKPDAEHPLLAAAIERARAELRAWAGNRGGAAAATRGAERETSDAGASGAPDRVTASATPGAASATDPLDPIPVDPDPLDPTPLDLSPLDLAPLWGTVLSASEPALAAYGIRTTPLPLWRTLLTGRPSRDAAVWAGRGQVEFLRTRVEIDAGLRPPDESWVLGRVWFELFPDTVRALDRAPLTPHDRARLGRVLAHQERASFGPSGQAARRLIALADAGMLEFTVGSPAPAECLDAVTIGAGVMHQKSQRDATAQRIADSEQGTQEDAARGRLGEAAPQDPSFLDPLFAELHARGLVTTRPGERGVFTAPDGASIGADGTRVEGLAVIGRPTEGPVLGNDTLDRTLHRDGARWATAAASRAALSTRR